MLLVLLLKSVFQYSCREDTIQDKTTSNAALKRFTIEKWAKCYIHWFWHEFKNPRKI